jgi:hypothetical protein
MIMCMLSGVRDALGNALVIKMKNLFSEVEILKHSRSARADLQRVLVIGHRAALGGGQDSRLARCSLVKLAAFTPDQLLIVNGRRPGGRARRFRGRFRNLGHVADFPVNRVLQSAWGRYVPADYLPRLPFDLVRRIIRSTPSKAGYKSEQPLNDNTHSQARDDVARPVGEQDNSRQHQTASNGPNSISFGRWQHRRR